MTPRRAGERLDGFGRLLAATSEIVKRQMFRVSLVREETGDERDGLLRRALEERGDRMPTLFISSIALRPKRDEMPLSFSSQ